MGLSLHANIKNNTDKFYLYFTFNVWVNVNKYNAHKDKYFYWDIIEM